MSDQIQEQLQQETAQQPEVSAAAQKTKDDNMRILRERAEAAERKALELQWQMEQSKKQPQQAQQEEEFNIREDDYVEGRHIKGLKKEIKGVAQQLEEERKRNMQYTQELQLRMQFPDLDKVVTPENIEKFKVADPLLAKAIANAPDMYTQAASLYTQIKKMGLTEDYSEEKQAIDKNMAKPKNPASLGQGGESPLHNANQFMRRKSQQEKKDIYMKAADMARYSTWRG